MTNNAHRQQWRNPKTAAITHRPRQRNTKSHEITERMNTMSITRKDLVAELARLNDTERERVLSEVAESAALESRMDATAAAVAHYVRPRKDS